MNRNHLHTVTSWLNDLNDLTAGATKLADSKRRIAALASVLFEEFPPGAFTRQSLIVVSRAYTFFPSYAEICKELSPWWKDHRPTPIAIADDRSAAVKQAQRDREVAESWANMTAAQVRAHIRELTDFTPTDMAIAHRGLLAHALKVNCPQHLGLLPPAWLKDITEPPERTALRAAAADIHAEVKRGPPE